MFVFFQQEMLRLLDSLNKLSNYKLSFLIIQLRLSDLKTLLSLPLKPFYCILVGITIECHFAHTQTQNGLTESLIKCLQLIA